MCRFYTLLAYKRLVQKEINISLTNRIENSLNTHTIHTRVKAHELIFLNESNDITSGDVDILWLSNQHALIRLDFWSFVNFWEIKRMDQKLSVFIIYHYTCLRAPKSIQVLTIYLTVWLWVVRIKLIVKVTNFVKYFVILNSMFQ